MFFAVFQLLALTALTAVQANDNVKDCSSQVYLPCFILIDASKITGKMPSNEEELDTECDAKMAFMKCSYDRALKCDPHLEDKNIEFIVATYQVTEKLCNKNNELRKRYLDNAKCIGSRWLNSTLACAPFQQIGQKEQCESRKIFYPCFYADVEKHCQKEAADVMKDILGPAEKFLDFSNLSCSEVVRRALYVMPYFSEISKTVLKTN